jgi:hypothetical protein
LGNDMVAKWKKFVWFCVLLQMTSYIHTTKLFKGHCWRRMLTYYGLGVAAKAASSTVVKVRSLFHLAVCAR